MTSKGTSCQPEHLNILVFDCLWLVVADNDRIVGVAPGNGRFVHLKSGSPQVRDVDPLVVLLVHCLQHDLLLLVVHLDYVVILRIGEIPDAPLEPLGSVLADEDRVVGGDLHQVLFGVESFCILPDLELPLDLAELLRPFPLSQKDFLGVYVALLNQLGAVGEQVVQLAATIAKKMRI